MFLNILLIDLLNNKESIKKSSLSWILRITVKINVLILKNHTIKTLSLYLRLQ